MHVQSAEAAGGRLGAVLSHVGAEQPVRLGPDGPWLATTLAQARQVLTDPAGFDFPGNVSRERDLSGSVADTRSGHYVFPPVGPERVQRGMAVFEEQWRLAVPDADGTTIDAMQALRRPVARSTCAAVLVHATEHERDILADAVLAWIDALGPVIAAPRPPRRWTRTRRQEGRTRSRLEALLEPHAAGQETAPVLATLLAAGIQVPIAAGSWLLAWLAAHPDRVAEPAHAVWEVLRLTPPTWITGRVAKREVRIGDAEIAPGELVMVSPLLLGRLPELVPGEDDDRADFAPHRWDTDQVKPGAWLPFGAGPHACPGRNLGLAMLHHLASWAGDQRLELVEPVTVDQSRGIAPSPALVAAVRGRAPS